MIDTLSPISLRLRTVHPSITDNETEPGYYTKAILRFAVILPNVTHERLAFPPGTNDVNQGVFM